MVEPKPKPKAKSKAKPKAKAKSTVKAKPKSKPRAKPKAKAKAKPKAKVIPKTKAAVKRKPKTKKSKAKAPDKRIGNQFWQLRGSHGRNPTFKTPDKLWDACEEYFVWVVANPLKEHKQYHFQGSLKNSVMARMRAMTVKGLCIFLDISETTWATYCDKDEDEDKGFLGVTTRVRAIIDTQKFEGAAADLLNPNIIARDLGLKDAREISGPDGGPVEIDYAESARARLRGKLIPEAGSS